MIHFVTVCWAHFDHRVDLSSRPYCHSRCDPYCPRTCSGVAAHQPALTAGTQSHLAVSERAVPNRERVRPGWIFPIPAFHLWKNLGVWGEKKDESFKFRFRNSIITLLSWRNINVRRSRSSPSVELIQIHVLPKKKKSLWRLSLYYPLPEINLIHTSHSIFINFTNWCLNSWNIITWPHAIFVCACTRKAKALSTNSYDAMEYHS